MNDFIETLRSVGGVKPCDYADCNDGITKGDKFCPRCHGDGEILDLAPLLAKPKELEDCARFLSTQLVEVDKEVYYGSNRIPHYPHPHGFKNLFIIGPQRAHSLVYEVARQLGGTACRLGSIMEGGSLPRITCDDRETGESITIGGPYCHQIGYKLLTPIPPDATVLFVTDRVDEKEMSAIMDVTMESAQEGKPHQFLTYVLALVSHLDKWVFPDPEKTEWKIISLHQEKA